LCIFNYMNNLMPIRFKIHEMMAKRDIFTNKRLADMTGIAPWRVGEMVKGKVKRIDVETLEKLCRALGCQPGELLEFVDD